MAIFIHRGRRNSGTLDFVASSISSVLFRFSPSRNVITHWHTFSNTPSIILLIMEKKCLTSIWSSVQHIFHLSPSTKARKRCHHTEVLLAWILFIAKNTQSILFWSHPAWFHWSSCCWMFLLYLGRQLTFVGRKSLKCCVDIWRRATSCRWLAEILSRNHGRACSLSAR